MRGTLNIKQVAADAWQIAKAMEAARPPETQPATVSEFMGIPTGELWRYRTMPGESAAGIAMRELKDEGRWREIVEFNSQRFPDMGANDYYPVGTLLTMPPKPKAEVKS